MRKLDHTKLEPIELLVRAVADLEPVTVQYPGDPELQYGPPEFVTHVAASNELEIFCHALPTGLTREVDPETFTLRSSLQPIVEASALVFTERFEPFGGHWPRPRLSELQVWVRQWRDCHALDEDTTTLDEFVASWHESDEEDFVVDTPVFMVTMRASDLERAEALVRELHRRERTGDYDMTTPETQEPPLVGPQDRELLDNNVTLTSAEVAIVVKRTENTVRKWRSAGKGPPYHKVTAGRSGGVYYLPDEVEAWLRAHRGRD